MSSLLRHPGIVPSLFSDGIDRDLGPLVGASLPRRAVTLVAHGLVLLWSHRGSMLLKPGSAIVGGLVTVGCCQPLLHTVLAGSVGAS